MITLLKYRNVKYYLIGIKLIRGVLENELYFFPIGTINPPSQVHCKE
jgi:hypothetical protein